MYAGSSYPLYQRLNVSRSFGLTKVKILSFFSHVSGSESTPIAFPFESFLWALISYVMDRTIVDLSMFQRVRGLGV